MSLKNIDFDSAFRRLAEKRIEEAMAEGKFDNLPGAGKPIELEPLPANEDARLAWWALRIMKQNDFTPDEIRWRKQLDALRDELAASSTERRVRALVHQINGLVRQINTLGTNALKTAVSPVSLEGELRKLSERAGAVATEAVAGEPLATSHNEANGANGFSTNGLQGDTERQCGNPRCKTENPSAATFCRRCGEALTGGASV